MIIVVVVVLSRRDQLDRALARLGLPYLDVYLLHNPEYYITHMVKSREDIEIHLPIMMRRIYDVRL